MKKLFSSWWQKLLSLVLSVFGISVCVTACPVMYGMPPEDEESQSVQSDSGVQSQIDAEFSEIIAEK